MAQRLDSSSSQEPRLRLVGRGPHGSLTLRFVPTTADPQTNHGANTATRRGARHVPSDRAITEPDTGLEPTDPRWVLAVRTQQVLEGATLRPAVRAELLRVGRLLGLNPFDANLVIAIVQDQARRGGGVAEAAASLRRVPLQPCRVISPTAQRVLKWCAVVLALEVLIIWALI